MASNPEEKGINKVTKVIQDLEKEIINGILDYLRSGIFPNNDPSSYMNAYTTVNKTVDEDNNTQNEHLFNYHNRIIQEYIEDCCNLVKKESKSQFIDSFIKLTEKINFLIYSMNRIFTHLDRLYTKYAKKNTLSQNAISLYRQYFFDPLQSDVYIEVNKLIK